MTRWTKYVTQALLATFVIYLPTLSMAQTATSREPVRRTFTFAGGEREYFVHLPAGFDRTKTYWPLVAVHGSGGNGRTFFLSNGLALLVAAAGFDAIVISPSFPNDDDNASRFPALREGEFLERVIDDARRDFRLRPKMLLTGYSRGGQFAHRFALAHPDQVEAVAPIAAGTWTTPDGRLFIEEVGEVEDPRVFLSAQANASKAPDRLKELFQPRVAAVASARAADGAQRIPFLVMCGTLDPRLSIARDFVQSLERLGYGVTTEWPRTPHACTDAACHAEFDTEFGKYPRAAFEFFQRVTRAR